MSSSTTRRCPRADDLAAYMLGALGQDELPGFEHHLAGCELCAHDMADLAIAVEALPATVPAAVPPPALKERIMTVVNREAELLAAAGPEADRVPAPSRKRRSLLPSWLNGPGLAFGAAGLIAAGIAVGVAVDGGPGAPETRTLSAQVDQRAAPGAKVALELQEGRALLTLRGMPNPPAGRVYQVWLQRGDDPPSPTDVLFSPSRRGRASVEIPGGVEGVKQVLVTDEPAGGSDTPTRTPVIAVGTA